MRILTNAGNPLALKLLVCAKYGGHSQIVVEQVTLDDAAVQEPKHLPLLELDDGTQIFMTDAVVKYLVPGDENLVKRDEWLRWSTSRLVPALCHTLAGDKRAQSNARQTLNVLFKKLEEALKRTTYLVGEKLTAADLSVWSLLALKGVLDGAQDVDNLLRWHRAIAALAPVQAAVGQLPLKTLNFASLKDANRFGGLLHLQPMSEGDEEARLLSEASGVAETVTAEEIQLARESFVHVAVPRAAEQPVILPKPGERNVMITSALPYVNNVPHLGNIIGCVLSADFFARYCRLAGYNTLYVCGTDEYGTATETKALAEGMTPKQICDKYFELHNGIYRWFGIGFDYFGRTSTPQQTQIVQEMFLDLQAAGFVETQTVEQLLCQKCDRYLADRFVEGTCPHPGCGFEDARGDQCDGCGKLINAIDLVRPRCKMCNASPVVRESRQFFIDLPKIEPRLRAWFETVELGWTHNARVITRAWLKEGLKPRCITRDLKWGIPVPVAGFEGKVFYVWFDAPIGYISITSRYTKEWRQWWQPKPETPVELYQFMAKDNVPFHAIMFPATLLGVDRGHTVVSHIMATEYLNYEDGKFSKSRGIGVFGNDAQDTGIPSDVWRFYLASARPEGQDSSFSWSDLAARNNSELLNNLGNFVNRALVFCEKTFDSTVPAVELASDDLVLLALVNRELKGYVASMERARIRDGVRHLLAVSRHGNQFMQAQQPWVLAKGGDAERRRAGTVIALCCNLAALLATLMFPFIPETARVLLKQLNTALGRLDAAHPQMRLLLPAGHKIGKPAPLFTKIEPARLEELKRKYGGVQQGENSPKASPPPPPVGNKFFTSTREAEDAVAAQGEKVRALKASGVEKSVWQPEVTILLELKKQLEALKAKEAPPTAGEPDPEVIKALEAQIAKQADKVRQLKADGDKSLWQPEVEILLALKKKLADKTGQPTQPTASSGKSKKKK